MFCFYCGLPLDGGLRTVPGQEIPAGIPGGFWIRLGAWLIDFVILTLVQSILIAIWPGFTEYFTSDAVWHWVDLVGFVIGAAYYVVGVAVWSTTVGKLAMGLQVLRWDGAKVGPVRAFCRYLAGMLSLLVFGIGYLMIGLRRDKRGLHDLICDTAVVRRR